MDRSMRTTSGRSSSARRTASCPSPGLPDDGDAGHGVEDHRQALPVDGVVVRDDDPQGLEVARSCAHLRRSVAVRGRRPHGGVVVRWSVCRSWTGSRAQHRAVPPVRARRRRRASRRAPRPAPASRRGRPRRRCGAGHAAPVVGDRQLECIAQTLDPEPHLTGTRSDGSRCAAPRWRRGGQPPRRQPAGRRGRRAPPPGRRVPLVPKPSATAWRASASPRSSRAAGRRPSTMRRTVATAPVSRPSARAARRRHLVILRQAANLPDLERHRREHRAEVVVQVAPETPPLLLAGDDEALARGLQGLAQVHGVGGDGDVAGQVVEQPEVARRQRRPACADRRRGGPRRHPRARAAPGCRPRSGDPLAVTGPSTDVDDDPRQLQGLSHRVRRPAQRLGADGHRRRPRGAGPAGRGPGRGRSGPRGRAGRPRPWTRRRAGSAPRATMHGGDERCAGPLAEQAPEDEDPDDVDRDDEGRERDVDDRCG